MKVGVAVADIFTGLYGTVAILAALNERRTRGLGQHVDLALLDVQIATLANQGMNYLASGKAPQRHGNAHPNIVPYQAFATRDGHIVAAVGNDAQFARFVTILGVPKLSANPRFQRTADRVRNRADLLPVLTAKIRTWSKAELLRALDEVFEDPHVVARGPVIEQRLHDEGAVTKLVGNPIRFSHTPIEYGRSPPRLGAHTSEVLRRDLAKPEAEVARLAEQGIVSNNKALIRRRSGHSTCRSEETRQNAAKHPAFWRAPWLFQLCRRTVHLFDDL